MHEQAIVPGGVDPMPTVSTVIGRSSAGRRAPHAAGRTPTACDPVGDAGRLWGPFPIEATLGRGAFGTVYRALDLRANRRVALKLAAAGAEAHLQREGWHLARVRHPNVVTLLGAAAHERQPGLWMELVQGETLSHVLATRGLMDAVEAARIGRDLCRALAAVHGSGLVHCDVKARNVMRADDGRVVLLDFRSAGVLRCVRSSGRSATTRDAGTGPPPRWPRRWTLSPHG